MNDYSIVPVDNIKPDARTKSAKAEVMLAVLDKNGNVVGFEIMYSVFRKNGVSWFKIGDPFGVK